MAPERGVVRNGQLIGSAHTSAAVWAMLFGHAQVALTNSLRGSNPFSEACLIAMDYGHRTVINDDWKKIFDDTELNELIARMLHIDSVRRQPVVDRRRRRTRTP